MLTHPEIAEPLRNTKLSDFEQSQADQLRINKYGCALHLNAGPALNKVVHPVVLLAEVLPNGRVELFSTPKMQVTCGSGFPTSRLRQHL